MTSARGIPSQSPHSSSGHAESTGGTPDTSLTAFSPEEVKTSRASIASSLGGVSLGGASLGACQNDPFITNAQQTAHLLSATATTFHPVFRKDAFLTYDTTTGASTAVKSGKTSGAAVLASVPKSSSGSTTTQEGIFSTDTGATRGFRTFGSDDLDVSSMVDTTIKDLLNTGFKFVGRKVIVAIGNTVYFRFSNLEEAASVYATVKNDHPMLNTEYMAIAALGMLLSPKAAKKSAHEGQIVLTACYPIHASTTVDKKAFEDAMRTMLQVEGKLCAWQKISATEAGTFRLIAEFKDVDVAQRAVKRCKGIAEHTSTKDGVGLSVQLHEPDLTAPRLVPQQSTPTRRSAEATGLGDAMSTMSLGTGHGTYTNSEAGTMRNPIVVSDGLSYMHANGPYALSQTSAIPMGTMGGFYAPQHAGVFPQSFHPGLAQLQQVPGNAPTTVHRPLYDYEERASNQANSFQAQNGGESSYHGPRRSISHMSIQYEDIPNRRVNAVKVPHHGRGRASNAASAHHNHVEISRIQQGIDVRTTVMLRNIPNKLDQIQLKSILDESSFGKYDFMYLRIDFSNNCNVGYAFINFNDPLDIIDFVRARSGEKWHRFKSDKVAEVSYATIQGKDCLVQKFRNSSVMLEPPHYRPKLYRTHTDATGRIGEEERFPDSDNASKLKRSCENAEHVGLFAPSAGQHMRDEQRRRRSQYDRGTSLAEQEEYVYEGYEAIREEYPAYGPPINYPSY